MRGPSPDSSRLHHPDATPDRRRPVPRRRKLALVLLAGYLAIPLDLVPDFIPVVGQLDDALIAGLALRYALRGAGRELIAEHWPGPPESLAVVMRVAGGS